MKRQAAKEREKKSSKRGKEKQQSRRESAPREGSATADKGSSRGAPGQADEPGTSDSQDAAGRGAVQREEPQTHARRKPASSDDGDADEAGVGAADDADEAGSADRRVNDE